jgi:hypothetical protein
VLVGEDEVGSRLGFPDDSDGDDRLGEGFGGFPSPSRSSVRAASEILS